MSRQRLITVFTDFKASGNIEHQIPAGYKVIQVVSSSLESATPLVNSSVKFSRLAITILLEQE